MIHTAGGRAEQCQRLRCQVGQLAAGRAARAFELRAARFDLAFQRGDLVLQPRDFFLQRSDPRSVFAKGLNSGCLADDGALIHVPRQLFPQRRTLLPRRMQPAPVGFDFVVEVFELFERVGRQVGVFL